MVLILPVLTKLSAPHVPPEHACVAKQGWGVDQLSIIATKHYKPRMVERTNIMTGEKFKEDVNTPRFCSPSSESFWSM
jgi:hypothetical protein